MRAGRPRTQGTPARPGCYPLQDFWEAPACHLPFQASGRPNSPLLPVWGWGMLTGVDFLASPCVPSAVSGIRTPKLPLLPVWKKGQGDEGQKRAGMQNITHLSQEIYLEQGVTPGLNGRWGNRHAARCTESRVDQNDESGYNVRNYHTSSVRQVTHRAQASNTRQVVPTRSSPGMCVGFAGCTF